MRTRTLDLHGYDVELAIEMFRRQYETLCQMGGESCLDVIHGIGHVPGSGGIRIEFRRLLKRYKDKLEYEYGETFDANPGHTIVWPKHSLLSGELRCEKQVPLPPAPKRRCGPYDQVQDTCPPTTDSQGAPSLIPQKGQELVGEITHHDGEAMLVTFIRGGQTADVVNPDAIPSSVVTKRRRGVFLVILANKREIRARFLRING
jgi:hypothetical protein